MSFFSHTGTPALLGFWILMLMIGRIWARVKLSDGESRFGYIFHVLLFSFASIAVLIELILRLLGFSQGGAQ